MRYIQDLKEGSRVQDIYLCKQKNVAVTKNGKEYMNVILQDKTGTIDAKVWEPNGGGIDDFDSLDYVDITGDVTTFNGALQLNIKRVRMAHEGEYEQSDYFPVSEKNIDEMFTELLAFIDSIENAYLKQLLESFFIKDTVLQEQFKKSSAAKMVHHGFIGGLLEHTLSVTKLCDFYCKSYPVLNRDLLLTAAMCHDIGKTKELSLFPENSYTDEGQLLGHIVMGSEMIAERVKQIDGFPTTLSSELRHCILAHHGEYEYGSPKKPALMEALALYYADDTDAKLETFKELLGKSTEEGWLGFNRLLDSNVRATKG